MGTLAKIRRWYVREQVSIREISRRTGMSRNTVKSWLGRDEMQVPKYKARVPVTKLDAFAQTLTTWLKANAQRNKHERRTVLAMYQELVVQGYAGGYGQVALFARRWRAAQGTLGHGAAYVPLKFALGEAFQFDWSCEYAWIGGLRRRIELAHTKLCASRAFWLTGYPGQTHEMLFDAHARAFATFGGVPQRGIYDNMKTAVDRVGYGKKRVVNARFEAMAGHYLFEPEFCTPGSGWEKGIVEKNVQDRRSSLWLRARDVRRESFEQLNAWLAKACVQAWSELNHPQYTALKVADVLQDEQQRLMPNPKPFDGYVELLARVSSTALIHLQRNRYSVPSEHAPAVMSLRVYPERVDIVANNVTLASHQRSFERAQTFYDWRHHIDLIQRKPGAMRNGAPFETMPEDLRTLQTILLRHEGGDAVMAQVLAAVPSHSLEAVLVPTQVALEAGKPSAQHVLNILARLKQPVGSIPEHAVSDRLNLTVPSLANVQRYDSLGQEVSL